MKILSNLDLNSTGKVINAVDPTSAQDVATKNYVDAVAAGVRDPKDSTRAATTSALPTNTRTGNVLTATANGTLGSIDGVAVVVADRVLVKNEATGANNGIYTVTSVGAGGAPWVLTRAADADSSAEVTGGLYVWVNEGTTNVDTGWLLTTDDPITLNTTALTFSQVSGLGQVTAGAGLTKTANTLDVGAGTGITVGSDTVSVDVTVVTRKYTALIGNGAATSIAVSHNLANQYVTVQIFDAATNAQVFADVTQTDANTVTIGFLSAPASNSLRVVVVG